MENINPKQQSSIVFDSSTNPPFPSKSQFSIAEPPPFPGKSIIRVLIGIILFCIIILGLVFFLLPFFATNKEEDVTLVYWGLFEDKNVLEPIIAEFEKKHPHIKVEYEMQNIRRYREKLTTRINNGTGPDIFRYHNSWVPMFAKTLLPLSTTVVPPAQFKKNYYPVSQKDLVKDGAILGLPLQMDTLALLVNKKIFDAAGVAVPTNWNDFVNTAKILTVKDENGRIKTSGAALGTVDNVTHATDIVSLLFVQNGVDLLNIGKTPERAMEALEFYTSFAKSKDNVWDNTLDSSDVAFVKENLAMFFGYSYDVSMFHEKNPSLVIEVYPVPSLSDQNMTIASYYVEGISSKSKSPKAAQELLSFLAQKDTQIQFYTQTAKTRLFGEPYARIDLAETIKGNKLIFPFLKQAPNAVSTFFASNTYDDGLNAQMNGYLSNAIRAYLGSSSSLEAVKTLASGVTEKLQLYGL